MVSITRVQNLNCGPSDSQKSCDKDGFKSH